MLQSTLTSFIKSALRLFIARHAEDEWRTVALDRLRKTREGLHLIPGESKPFTGSGLRWFSDRQIAEEARFRYGAPHGPWTTWHPTGSLLGHHQFQGSTAMRKSETWFRGGLKHGMETSWHGNGNRAFQAEYHDGIRQGLYIRWHANGSMRSEVPYHKGVPSDGVHRIWRVGGKLQEESTYRHGRKTRRVTWDPGGQIVMDQKY
jgi:antitoxin component YwqK of YwqJK toxin-antitoxin module